LASRGPRLRAAARFAAALVFTALVPLQAQRYADPDSVRFITSDVANFWDAVDSASSLDLAQRIADGYLGRASLGLRAFAPMHVGGSFNVARAYWTRRDEYARVRDATLRIRDAEPAMRAALARLRSLYPSASFVDVYFVIGLFGIGGWSSGEMLVVGAEMYPDPKSLPWIVAHEMVHKQQAPIADNVTLLERAFNEGSADFIGELVSGGTINAEAQRYGRAHEHELWQEFSRAMHGHTFAPWLYAYDKPVDRPADLGYFFGYRIAEAYYDRATDKAAAIRDIIRAENVDDILKRSGYSP
jgi:hypothetical protein